MCSSRLLGKPAIAEVEDPGLPYQTVPNLASGFWGNPALCQQEQGFLARYMQDVDLNYNR